VSHLGCVVPCHLALTQRFVLRMQLHISDTVDYTELTHFRMSFFLDCFSIIRYSRIRRTIDDRDRTASKRFNRDRDQVDSISRCRRLVLGEWKHEMRVLLIPNEFESNTHSLLNEFSSQKGRRLGSNRVRRMCRMCRRKMCRKTKRQYVSLRAPGVADQCVAQCVAKYDTYDTIFFSVQHLV
jgi:hypothetical protein